MNNYKAISSKNLEVNKSDHSIISRLNIFCSILFVIWTSWPFSNYLMGRYYTGIVISFIWLISINWKLMTKLPHELFWFFIFFISLIPYVISNSFAGSDYLSVFGVYYLSFIGIFINYYYMFLKRDYKTLKSIALTAIVFYVIGSIQTYIGLLQHPLAARMLAGAIVRDPQLGITYSELGIGGFGYIYSACFVAMSLVFLLKQKIKIRHKIYIIISLISMILMILKASYATAILILLFGSIVIIILDRGKSLFISLMLVFIIFLVVPSEVEGNLMKKFASIFSSNEIIYERILDLSNIFTGDIDQTLTGNRRDKYLSSLYTFFKFPMFGVYGPLGNQKFNMIGGHSGWLDFLASYGLFSTIPLVAMICIVFTRQLKFYKNSGYYVWILVLQIIYIGFGLINPIMNIHEIGISMFLIIPSIPFIQYNYSE